MTARHLQTQRTLVLALLVSLVMLAIVPSNTINVKALTGFVKTSPSNGATGQAVSVALKWNAAPSNPYGFDQYYKYCYYLSNGTCDFQGLLYTTQYTISGLATGRTYYWQIQVVYCKDKNCVQKEKYEANNGQVWSFTTLGINPPGAFAKSSPADNTVNLTNTVLSWGSSPGATSYQYCFSVSSNDNDCLYLGGWKDVGNITTYTLPKDSYFIWGNRYYWQIRASNDGGTKQANDGVWWTFTTPDLVGKTTLLAPNGTINTSIPTYRWNHITGVTWYFLWVNGSTGNVIQKWYEATKVCSGGICEVTPSILLKQDNYIWWVQTWNNTGYGRWSDGMTFNTPVAAPPQAATLTSPAGDIGADYSPTYTWNKVHNATWYYLSVNGPSGYSFANWYLSSDICNMSTCSIANVTPNLISGPYSWKIQTWNEVGYGPWSTPLGFNIPIPPPPGPATLTSPSGDIGTNNPTYAWTKVSDASWYYLWIDGPSGNVLKNWYTSTQSNCIGLTCSLTNITPNLPAGEYSWKVQTWNYGGLGSWSNSLTFTLSLPGKATLSSPTGDIGTTQPIYTWNAVSNSTWYYLWVDGPNGNVIKQWYTSAEANCDATTCSVTPTTVLNNGAYTWWIQTWNDAGYGPWSGGTDFTIP